MATITSPRSSSPAVPNIVTPPSVASTNNTPTSSVRPSIDLPSNPLVQSNASNPTNHRRNRAALRDYYNLKAKAVPSPTAGVSPGASTTNLSRSASVTSATSESTVFSNATLTTDTGHGSSALPNTLDDPSFDAEAYVATLLKTSSLRDILRTESSLVSEIRNLDGERKALVYDNYSKLIAAVGTIGDMQRAIVNEGNSPLGGDRSDSELARMKGLEGKLDSLMNGFRAADGGTRQDDLNGEKALASDRRRVREEKRRKKLVSWVLDAPDRLRILMDNVRQEEAEKEWKEIETLLNKWSGVDGVQQVREACKRAMEVKSEAGE